MKVVLLISVLIAFSTLCASLPSLDRRENVAGLASQVIAVNVLKDNVDVEDNFVFAPLGISSMLGILAEGANGPTYEEFVKALGFPEDKQKLRESYKNVLKGLQKNNLEMNPSFKTWLYIYRNNTAKEEFKQILRDYYFVEVKDIDRHDYNWNDPNTSPTISSNSKDIIDFEELKKSEPVDDTMDDELDEQKDASKFDKVVEDKQYVEVPVIKEEIAKEMKAEEEKQPKLPELPEEVVEKAEKSEPVDEKLESLSDEENETINESEKLDNLKKDLLPDTKQANYEETDAPEKISIPLKKLEALEIMEAIESHFLAKRFTRARTLFNKDDVTSALSANSIIGRDDVDPQTKMLLFNGLYYHGNWAYPFQQLRSTLEDVFYVKEGESIPANMMKSQGNYRYADCEYLNSQLIEFPYENSRFSLLVLSPYERNGLRDLVEKLQPEDLQKAISRLQASLIEVRLPKFNIETTSRSEKVMQKLGLKSVFAKDEADLSNLSDAELYVDELVQHVNIRVDEGSSSENILTGTAALRTFVDSEKSVVLDHPFLYFVRDNLEDHILVAGKILRTEYKDEVFF